jgi:hypothetical protein
MVPCREDVWVSGYRSFSGCAGLDWDPERRLKPAAGMSARPTWIMQLARFAFVPAALLLLAFSHAVAQQAAPAGADFTHLTLACAASPCRFRQGETIRMELTFRADLWGYGVKAQNTQRYQRDCDRFTAEPAADVIDPMSEGISHWLDIARGATRVGLNALDPLGGHGTETVRLELNEWLYFRKPGAYKVRVTSRRMCRDEDCLELTSAPIDIQIVAADADWQRRELDRLTRLLPGTGGWLDEPERAVVRALTYLGTDDALREVERRLVGATYADPIWGLAKSALLKMTARPAG